jgi:dynein heavy chain, axonemal
MLTNEVLKKKKEDISIQPACGVYIYGLFLEGAAWSESEGHLIDAKSKSLFYEMPVMHLSATNESVETSNDKTQFQQYICPIYKKPVRTDSKFITAVNLNVVDNIEKWILRGTCLLCDIK